MFWMPQRSMEKELIDLGPTYYTPDEYSDCMRKLGKVGQWLGGDRATLSAFDKLTQPPESILDVGCGGGDGARMLAKRYPKCRVEGIDFSKQAIEIAQSHPDNRLYPHLSFSSPDVLELNAPSKSYDVVTATLVCHHMDDVVLADFLKRAADVAKKAVIINDLHRHPVAYASYWMMAPLLFRNRLISHDGLVSIQRSFTQTDWIRSLSQAGFDPQQWSLNWKWAFRWILLITV